MRDKTAQQQDSITLIEQALHQLATKPMPLPQQEARAMSQATGLNSQQRRGYWQGLVNDNDLGEALALFPHLAAGQTICVAGQQAITREAVYRCALLFDFNPIPARQLRWLSEEKQILNRLQTDLPAALRQQWQSNVADEAELTGALWEVLLNKLGGGQDERLLALTPEQDDEWLLYSGDRQVNHTHTQQQARNQLQALLADVGISHTLGGLVLSLSGLDILDAVIAPLERICACGADNKVAAWHLPLSEKAGLYAAWRTTLHYDANLFLHELPDWQQMLDKLPDQPLACIAYQLTELGIGQYRWAGYLQCLLTEAAGTGSTAVADYLAIRLTLDRLWLNQACHDIWKVEASLGALQGYFNKNLSELLVRQHLYQGDLPEYLTHRAEALIIRSGSERSNREDWQHLADLIQTWQINAKGQYASGNCQGNDLWRLFRLCQHLGLTTALVDKLADVDLLALLSVLDGFDEHQHGAVWQAAYAHHDQKVTG